MDVVGHIQADRLLELCAVYLSERTQQITPEITADCRALAGAAFDEHMLSVGWAWLLGSGPTPVVFLASLVLAYIGYKNTKQQTKLRATLDTISHSQSTETYREGRETFYFYAANDPRALACLASKSASRHIRLAIISHINHYEEIAGGVAEEILDKAHVRRLLRSIVEETWHKGVFFIHQQRWDRDQDSGALLKYQVTTDDCGRPVGKTGDRLTFGAKDVENTVPLEGEFVFETNDQSRLIPDRDNGKPYYRSKKWIELQNLAKEFGADSKFFPKENGGWVLKKEDIKSQLEALRIRYPKESDATIQILHDYNEVCEDVVALTLPLSPDALNEMASRSVYHCDGTGEGKVLPENVRHKDWAPETIEKRLNEISEAISQLHIPKE